MLCDVCRERDATVTLTHAVKGEVNVLHLCQRCAADRGIETTVTTPLKNFRWNESPLFALNKLEAIGIPERVDTNTEVPALKIRDFNFTSLSDAV